MDSELKQLIIAGFEALGLEYSCEDEFRMQPIHLFTKPKRTRKAKEVTYSDEFEQAWKLYPKKEGNKKKAAYTQWNNRLKTMSTGYESVMIDGTRRYAAYCKATEKPEQFVNQASTFYGPDKLYLQEWTIPPQKLTKAQKKEQDWANPPNGGYEAWEVMRLINKRIES
jgi:hypothetical protein